MTKEIEVVDQKAANASASEQKTCDEKTKSVHSGNQTRTPTGEVEVSTDAADGNKVGRKVDIEVVAEEVNGREDSANVNVVDECKSGDSETTKETEINDEANSGEPTEKTTDAASSGVSTGSPNVYTGPSGVAAGTSGTDSSTGECPVTGDIATSEEVESTETKDSTSSVSIVESASEETSTEALPATTSAETDLPSSIPPVTSTDAADTPPTTDSTTTE